MCPELVLLCHESLFLQTVVSGKGVGNENFRSKPGPDINNKRSRPHSLFVNDFQKKSS